MLQLNLFLEACRSTGPVDYVVFNAERAMVRRNMHASAGSVCTE